MEQPSEFFYVFRRKLAASFPLILPKGCFNPEFGAFCAIKLQYYLVALSRVKEHPRQVQISHAVLYIKSSNKTYVPRSWRKTVVIQ